MDNASAAQLDAERQAPKITENDVRMAYTLILGREAETDAVVSDILSSGCTLSQLRQRFFESDEFKTKASSLLPALGGKPHHGPPIAVEVDVPGDTLDKMVRHIEANWQLLGETEPHWSVLTDDAYKATNLGNSFESFYETGHKTLSHFFKAAARCGVALSPEGVCFELGCGVGRITLALSKHFAKVVGGDISRAHLRLAEAATIHFGVRNIEYVHLQTMDALSRLPKYDYFFSLIVFQHNPPPVIKSLLSTILRKLKEGGVAYFQVPVYKLRYSFDAQEYLSKASCWGEMEMHVLPQAEIFKIIKESGCDTLEVREDGHTGSPDIISNSFLVRKMLDDSPGRP